MEFVCLFLHYSKCAWKSKSVGSNSWLRISQSEDGGKEWDCKCCGKTNNDVKGKYGYCVACGNHKDWKKPNKPLGDWVEETCNPVQQSTSTSSIELHELNDTNSAEVMSRQGVPLAGNVSSSDWKCECCGRMNPKDWSDCKTCGAPPGWVKGQKIIKKKKGARSNEPIINKIERKLNDNNDNDKSDDNFYTGGLVRWLCCHDDRTGQCCR